MAGVVADGRNSNSEWFMNSFTTIDSSVDTKFQLNKKIILENTIVKLFANQSERYSLKLFVK